jgi:hypothetical protein
MKIFMVLILVVVLLAILILLPVFLIFSEREHQRFVKPLEAPDELLNLYPDDFIDNWTLGPIKRD